MVGSATAMHLSKKMKPSDVGPAHRNMIRVISAAAPASADVTGRVPEDFVVRVPSSSDDVSRMVASTAPAAETSRGWFRTLEKLSGVEFWHEEPGFLEIVSGDVFSPSAQAKSLEVDSSDILDEFDLRSFFKRGYQRSFTAKNRGWIDPRGFVRANRLLAEKSGKADWLDGRSAVSVSCESGGGPFVVSTACGSTIVARAVVVACGAFALLTPDLFPPMPRPESEGEPTSTSSDLEPVMWGKCVYHAEVSEETARSLNNRHMPCFLVKPDDDCVPASEIRYAMERKSTSYFYGFPPVQYPDGKWRVKIGHSPFDPLVGELGRAKENEHHKNPSPEQVATWYAGRHADPCTVLGKEVRRQVSESEAFFADILERYK